jgi:hypothetical protein
MFHSFVQKGGDKDVDLVVDFLESWECHGHAHLKDMMMFVQD